MQSPKRKKKTAYIPLPDNLLKCQLHLSIPIVEIKNQINKQLISRKLDNESSTFVTCVLEYITKLILRVAITQLQATGAKKEERITPRYLQVGTRKSIWGCKFRN